MENLYSEREAAELIGISRPTIRKYRKLGYLNPVETRHAVLYSLEELRNFKTAFRNKQISQSNKSH
jgi:DNA-binding transcriptional MerR regulator